MAKLQTLYKHPNGTHYLLSLVIFSDKPGKPVSHTADHKIDLLALSAVPPHPCLHHMSEDKLKAVKATIADYLAKGWIQISTSPYGAPVVVIHKKIGELHIVINYNMLNKQTCIDSYPIPWIDKLLNRLGRVEFFTKIDLASRYYQVKMAEGHEYKTTFTMHYGTYE